MAGKRILDAAKLFNTARAIGRQHLGLRREQWEVLKETSSAVKAVKWQTDRVTVTVGAAWELGKVFAGDEKAKWTDGAEVQAQRAGQEVRRTAEEVRKAGEQVVDNVRDGVEGVAAEVRRDSAVAEDIAAETVSGDDGSLAALRKREEVKQAEMPRSDATITEQPVAEAASGVDTFSERGRGVAQTIDTVPQTELPEHVASEQGSDKHVQDKELNQDVYYSATSKSEQAEEVPEEINLDIFSSPKVSQILGQRTGGKKNPYGNRQRMSPKPLPEMVKAAEQRRREQEAAAERAQAKASESAEPQVAKHDAETADLASSIAKDTTQQAALDAPLATEAQPAATAPYEMRESRVPSSRFGRLWQYSGLATSMAFGAVGESLRRVTGSGAEGSLMLSEANMNRLVAKLSRMRGAALKLGQMISFQDSKVLPPTINAVLQRVQDSADYMPSSQRDEVLTRNLGDNWRELFSDFSEKPVAAASIGQVHKATLASNGKPVAVKIQYPGVRDSIDSDLNNISLLLTASRLLPKGLFFDKTVANARIELGWECDYIREAEACTRFKSLVSDEPNTFAVPTIYPKASGIDVLTADFMTGTAVTKIPDLTQSERDWIGSQVLRLCLREVMEWQFMQTDPNWTNFLYDRSSQHLELLDFGASRDFASAFIEPYVSLLIAASRNDRATCLSRSIELGYLTGEESKAMLDAHVDSILVLAEPFHEGGGEVYDFKDQTITDRVRANIGLMLRERLRPPPEETYSLHRKLSGAFLLCARLGSRVEAQGMFANAVKLWEEKQKSEGTFRRRLPEGADLSWLRR
ncbi:hypothetical protein B0A48_10264 [Cryoendolithus antarcticus]|uniref:ABC1 atypical kinase-like domain-containing protein n=1 Tax=Cryoendolithus antarcticus TaxID=1507870 RepID=A0A1V8SWY8_9PEZI|nr:hypothetical protein B0A48_10264 [Cryoendolithus antarcticus]